MTQTLLIWSSGSQAMLYHRLAEEPGFSTIIVDPERASPPAWLSEGQFSGAHDALSRALTTSESYIVAIGGEHGKPRHAVSCALEAAGLHPVTLTDPTATTKKTALIGPGGYLGQRCVLLNHDVELGRDCIINTAATLDHECQIDLAVHIMGAAAIAGRVRIGDYAVIGTNATILPDLTIGEGAYIGAGATITRDAAPFTVVIGAPAKPLKERTLAHGTDSVRLIEQAQQ